MSFIKQTADRPALRPSRLLAVSALTLACASTAVFAQDTVTPAIKGVVDAGTRIELIKDGFNGSEGPLGLPDGSFVFTETPANRITRIAADGSTSTFLDNSNGSNGLGINAAGEIVSVQRGKPQVGVIWPVARQKTITDNIDGTPYAVPNDLVVGLKAGIYFTDPGAQPRPGEAPPKPAVYHIAKDGKLTRVISDVERPNGIQLSPDEKTLYLANTAGEYVLAYDVAADGALGKARHFAKLRGGVTPTETGGQSSGADGLAIDKDGRLYVASNSGIEVFSAKGEALGVIALPKKPQNLAFAGKDKKTLYIVGRGSAWRIQTQTAGYAGRAK